MKFSISPTIIFALLSFSLLFNLSNTEAQKILQIEKYGKPKAKKYFIGDEVTYKLKGEEYWYTETIEDILVPENSVLFEHHLIKIEDITAIKSYKNRDWSKGLAIKLYLFSGSWALFSLAGPLVGWSITSAIYIVPAIGVATGWLLQKIFKSKTYKMGKRRKLRVLDLNMSSGPKNYL